MHCLLDRPRQLAKCASFVLGDHPEVALLLQILPVIGEVGLERFDAVLQGADVCHVVLQVCQKNPRGSPQELDHLNDAREVLAGGLREHREEVHELARVHVAALERMDELPCVHPRRTREVLLDDARCLLGLPEVLRQRLLLVRKVDPVRGLARQAPFQITHLLLEAVHLGRGLEELLFLCRDSAPVCNNVGIVLVETLDL
mmetsp:Transcript_60714/g.144445  ORF Transcript_60714/g.144445 Transcript_60714/m.144445 type:complete len:201 (-) Transcript_60714:735-1337(-)